MTKAEMSRAEPVVNDIIRTGYRTLQKGEPISHAWEEASGDIIVAADDDESPSGRGYFCCSKPEVTRTISEFAPLRRLARPRLADWQARGTMNATRRFFLAIGVLAVAIMWPASSGLEKAEAITGHVHARRRVAVSSGGDSR